MLLKRQKSWLWRKPEYYQATDLGWFDGERVELIAGELIEMAPQKDAHAAAVTKAMYALIGTFEKGFLVRVQCPMDLGVLSQPEPDLIVTKGSPASVLKHPKDGVLVVEIAETTLQFDRGRKGSLYAASGIRDYWIVNLVDRVVEVYRKPVADSLEPFGHRYSEVRVHEKDDSIVPLAAKRDKIKVSDLLP